MNVNPYEAVTIVFPQMDNDAMIAMATEREFLPEYLRQYFIGPLSVTNGNCIYILAYNGIADDDLPMRRAIAKTIQLARKINSNISLVRIAFGGKDKQTRVLESNDATIVSDEDMNLRLKINLLDGTNKILKSQLNETQRLRDRDTVLSEALNDLDYLRRQKELIEAVKEAGKELKTGALSDQSSQRILSLLDEIEKLQIKTKAPHKPTNNAPEEFAKKPKGWPSLGYD